MPKMNDTGIRAPHVMTRRFLARDRLIQPRGYLALALLTLGNVGCGDGDAGPSGVNAASASPDTSMSTSSSGNDVSTDATADPSQTSDAATTSQDSGQATGGNPRAHDTPENDSVAMGSGGGANDGSDDSTSNAGGAGGNPAGEPTDDDESVDVDSDDSSVADDDTSEASTDRAGGQAGDDLTPPEDDGVGGTPGAEDESGEDDADAAGASGDMADDSDSGDDMADDSSGDDSSGSDDGCPGAGNVEYSFNDLGAWPVDAIEKITPALDEALYYYNCYSDLSHTLTINYKPGVQTAEANVDGWISFGTDRNYMVTATVMHEIGHTMGVGFYPWSELMNDGRWIGSHVVQLMADLPADERDDDETSLRDYITADGQHFWPYGLNYASEHKSEWSLINHVRIVAAMNRDKDEFRGR